MRGEVVEHASRIRTGRARGGGVGMGFVSVSVSTCVTRVGGAAAANMLAGFVDVDGFKVVTRTHHWEGRGVAEVDEVVAQLEDEWSHHERDRGHAEQQHRETVVDER